MPVFHFTFHAYRSWNTDHPKGWTQHGEPGARVRTESLAIHRHRLAKHPPVRFTPTQQHAIIDYVHDICRRRQWQPHCITADPTHIHIVVAWRSSEEMEFVRDKLKSLIGLLLARAAGTRGKPWLSHGQDETPVLSMKHMLYLLHEYLPRHQGPFWRHEFAQHPAPPIPDEPHPEPHPEGCRVAAIRPIGPAGEDGEEAGGLRISVRAKATRLQPSSAGRFGERGETGVESKQRSLEAFRFMYLLPFTNDVFRLFP